MSLEAERLSALIEFCHQSARLRGKPTAAVSSHSNFSLYEHELAGSPGIRLNHSGLDGTDEIWISVDRLHETKPPEINSEWLAPWIILAKGPNEGPSLRESIDGSALLEAGTHTEDAAEGLPQATPNEVIIFNDYPDRNRVSALFEEYVKAKWTPWATEEKKRLKTIRLYAQLFTLKQQLEGGIVEAQLELVWGIGIGVWKQPSAIVSYPLVSQLVELSLNPITAALEIRPRDVNPRVELDWYATQDNPGVADLEKAAKIFFDGLPQTLSPFDRGTFEPLLRSAVTHLDANGVYWPSQTPAEDRTVPKADDKLKVTDTWVLFARPRTNSTYLQDLERLKAAAEELDELPPAVAAIVTDPDSENPEVEFPAFRGVSASYHSDGADYGSAPPSHKAKDLYFPKPFNDEQVRIIQLLEIFDGVVAQGPPGTGKTHTIANVICHYLANGKRVLVTSMKDPALGVLSDQLPDEIKPLAISLLTSEQEGLKKFEHSILKIASEVQSIDRTATSKEIRHLEESIDALHGQLARVDWDISIWAKKNLNKITIDGVDIDPADAAKELVSHAGAFEIIPDAINITKEHEPKFNDQDVIELRTARAELQKDLVYLDASLPQLAEFPDSRSILQTHQDLSRFEQLKREVESGDVPSLSDTFQKTIDSAIALKADIDELKDIRARLNSTGFNWISSLKSGITDPAKSDIKRVLDELGEHLKAAKEQRKNFLSKPVLIPPDFESNQELVEAVNNLSDGKRPFGLSGLIGKSNEKKALDAVQILGAPPKSIDEWKHVKDYVALQSRLRELAVRWNAIAQEIKLPVLEAKPQGGVDAIENFAIYEEVTRDLHLGNQIQKKSCELFSSWHDAENVLQKDSAFEELDRALRHHLTKNRLANVWSNKEQFQKILDGRSGPIVESIRQFLNETLGNPNVSDMEMQATWSSLMSELSRVLGLHSRLQSVRRVTDLVSGSGAPGYASQLRSAPGSLTADELLPSNWKQSWRLKRLDTYLGEIDAQAELKQLSKRRTGIEQDLSKAYQDVVVKRTWLKLAENASPSIRAALQAYLSAIQKIGKGTGKRAVRYRQDARNAASLANSAVPCWIMPHYRISESLPPELGCFDLVIVDEASQSDLTALPALLRAQKVLIVGDDKQVSPEGVGLEEEKIRNLMSRFLGKQVETYRPQMSPERSIYDLFKVVYAKSSVMLKEHFRCVGPIIEYSKREFYNHELRPLRLPRASERLDPPLIDVLVQDGYRDGDRNTAEARFIVEEIKKMVSDDKHSDRSIGVVSLLADKQAYLIWEMLTEELGPEYLQRHKIACGDARTFQGKERDVMFLSMVVAPNEQRISALSRDTYAQRFNVAASRARDRMYLVRSVALEHLSEADKLRRSLITHFATPLAQNETRQDDLRRLCESPFEREVYDALTERGFWVTPQVKVGQFRIDMVVEGNNDSRLAIECDGDKYHGPDKWADDMHRQRILERAGWIFWRCFASTWVRRKGEMIEDLVRSLAEHGIEPVGSDHAPKSIHTEQRIVLASELDRIELPETEQPRQQAAKQDQDSVIATTPHEGAVETEPAQQEELRETDAQVSSSVVSSTGNFSIPTFLPTPPVPDSPLGSSSTSSSITRRSGLQVTQYSEFNESLTGDPREVNVEWISRGLVQIIQTEGPVIAKRACDIYLRSVGIKRMGHEIKATMQQALQTAMRVGQIESFNETDDNDLMSHTMRATGTPPLVIRTRGDRLFEEITPSEIQFVAKYLSKTRGLSVGSDEHLRAVLEFFDLKRLTTQVGSGILDILQKELPHVDALLEQLSPGGQL